jgi:hypothetical protein
LVDLHFGHALGEAVASQPQKAVGKIGNVATLSERSALLAGPLSASVGRNVVTAGEVRRILAILGKLAPSALGNGADQEIVAEAKPIVIEGLGEVFARSGLKPR